MCLDINKNYKPVQSRTRKKCYKVVFETQDGKFFNLFATAEPTEYVIGKEIVSTRKEKELLQKEKISGVNSGFHMLKTIKDAKNFIEYAKMKCVYFALSFSESTVNYSILKCNVDTDNHIADGTFKINVFGMDEKVVEMPCALYTKITPIKKIYSEKL